MDFTAVIFVPALAASVIVSFVAFVYAAHYYLAVLQTTAAGGRRIVWATEPFVDNFSKGAYLAWMIGLWLGPAWLIGRALAAGHDSGLVRYLAVLGVFWVCYPVGQLSSLSGPSLWLPLHPGVIERLARRPGACLGFLLLSGLALAGAGYGFYSAFFAPNWLGLFFGAPLFVLGALVYARLLGRLAFVLTYTKAVIGGRGRKRPARSEADAPREPAPVEEAAFVQPRDLPPIETPDEGPLTGYDLKVERPRRPAAARVRAEAVDEPPARPRAGLDDDEDLTAYGVHEADGQVDPEERVDVAKPLAEEMKLLDRSDVPKAPTRAWTAEVLEFLLDPTAYGAIGLVCVLAFGAAGMVRIAIFFNPAR